MVDSSRLNVGKKFSVFNGNLHRFDPLTSYALNLTPIMFNRAPGQFAFDFTASITINQIALGSASEGKERMSISMIQ